ncbi:MAG: hypothetical protein AAF740_03310, partial [Bacteroidota bacterium]
LNPKQLESQVVQAKNTVAVSSRGFGKTYGLIATRMVELATQMPRGFFGFVGRSHRMIVDNIIPGIEEALIEYDWKRGYQYEIGGFLPSEWDIPMPYRALNDPKRQMKYLMHTSTGAAFLFISQRNPGSSNSLNLDAALGDEYRFLNHERFKNETSHAIRGNEKYFRNCPLHGSILITTDRPRSPEQRGVYEWREKHNEEQIEVIKGLAYEVAQLDEKLADPDFKRGRNKVEERRKSMVELLTWHRHNATLWIEGDTLDNVEVIGISKLESDWRQTPDTLDFLISRGNFDLGDIEMQYYPVRKKVHSYADELNPGYSDYEGVRNWRYDADIDTSLPLWVGNDYGTDINCCVTGQRLYQEIRILRSSFSLKQQDEKLSYLAREWCDYYEGYPVKVIYYCYDQTALVTSWDSNITPVKRWTDILESRGWRVIPIYVFTGYTGKSETHHDKMFWTYDKMFDEEDYIQEENNIRLRVNYGNANDLWKSMEITKAVEGANGKIKKVKKTEKYTSIPEWHKPHMGEALDKIVNTIVNYPHLVNEVPVF